MVHAVQAQVEGRIRSRRRRDGVRPRVLLAVRLGLLDGDKLPRRKAKLIHAFDGEFEVPGLRRQQNRFSQASRKRLPLDGGALLGLRFHDV